MGGDAPHFARPHMKHCTNTCFTRASCAAYRSTYVKSPVSLLNNVCVYMRIYSRSNWHIPVCGTTHRCCACSGATDIYQCAVPRINTGRVPGATGTYQCAVPRINTGRVPGETGTYQCAVPRINTGRVPMATDIYQCAVPRISTARVPGVVFVTWRQRGRRTTTQHMAGSRAGSRRA